MSFGDSYDDNAADVGRSLDLIEEEIESGLPLHAGRLCNAWLNAEYYRCRNAQFVPRRESEDWIDYFKRPKRTSKMTRKVIRELNKDLYNPGPTRQLANGSGVDTWLQGVYRDNQINAVYQHAYRLADLNGAAAIEARATGRDDKPVKLYLWGAHELIVFPWPDDPTEPWAVIAVNVERQLGGSAGTLMQERIRYEAWTRDEHRAYLSQWVPVTGDQRRPGFALSCYANLFNVAAELQPALSGLPAGSGKNPYGTLPFEFVHAEPVVSDFWEGEIGTPLRECNAEIDRELSDLAAHTREYMDPDRFLRNVKTSFRRDKSRGRWQHLPPGKSIEGDAAGSQPDAFLVQGQLAVEPVWSNILRYANTTLEELDVPLVAVRDDASTDLSGVAIVAKQLPLLSRTRSRQVPAAETEGRVCGMILTAMGNFYGEPRLTAAGADPKLTTLWPEPRMPLPTPERDEEDTADRAAGRKSQLRIVAERNGTTIDEAKVILERVADEELWYQQLLERKGLAMPAEPPPTNDAGNTGTDAAPNAGGGAKGDLTPSESTDDQ